MNRPDQPSEYVNITREIQTGGPTYVVAEMPYRDFSTVETQSLASGTDYTCVFGFVKPAKINNVGPGTDNPETLTEGVQDKANINTQVEVVDTSVNLTKKASNSNTGTDIWNLFNDNQSSEDFNHPGIDYDQNN